MDQSELSILPSGCNFVFLGRKFWAWKKIIGDNHCETICGPIRTECTSVRWQPLKLFVDHSKVSVLPSGCNCVFFQCTFRLWEYPVWRQSRGTTHLECYKSRILSRICGLLGLNCHKMKRTFILNSMHRLPRGYPFLTVTSKIGSVCSLLLFVRL